MTDKMLASVGIALGTVGTSLSIVCGIILCLAHVKPGVVLKGYVTQEQADDRYEQKHRQ